ncbi:MAG: hypothetical protein KKH91_05685 [Elusimicrobia bacterium]|nr:hypothetical protein [Elusimicrobiota bacterium]
MPYSLSPKYSGFSIDIILYNTKINIVNQTNNLYSYFMEFNQKDYFKGEKFEQGMKRFVEEHPDVSSEQLQAVREFYKNSTEEEINEILFEATNKTDIIKDWAGKREYKYYFFLNKHEDAAFTRCPKCDKQTKKRMFCLFIHIEPNNFMCNQQIMRIL